MAAGKNYVEEELKEFDELTLSNSKKSQQKSCYLKIDLKDNPSDKKSLYGNKINNFMKQKCGCDPMGRHPEDGKGSFYGFWQLPLNFDLEKFKACVEEFPRSMKVRCALIIDNNHSIYNFEGQRDMAAGTTNVKEELKVFDEKTTE